MVINTDINILGSLQDLTLITHFWAENRAGGQNTKDHHVYSSVKTEESFGRFRRAVNKTLLKFPNSDTKDLFESILSEDSLSQDYLLMLFWNASVNNDLLHYLNINVFFPAFYSGRLTIKTDEVVACIKELRETEETVREWSAYTIQKVSGKYHSLLKKFNLMEGGMNKKILHPYLSDKMLIFFIYWLKAIEVKTNLLQSDWLKYCFCEKTVFIDRLMQKKFSMYYLFTYTGDNLKIETTIPYQNIYHAVK